jgi:pimeloyl-ACP methyl ester carboxylesterase
VQETWITPELRHVEIYSFTGLLTLLWHGDPGAERVVVAGGGAAGGLLGPSDGLYQDLGVALAERGIATVRVGYRRPNDLGECVLDMAAAADLASRAGGDRFVTVGHSFGGAVAIGTAIALPSSVVGVVTLATQSGGCEDAHRLDGKPLLLVHGDRDEILPVACSETVKMIAGSGDLVVLPGSGHLLSEHGPQLRELLLGWIPEVLDRESA